MSRMDKLLALSKSIGDNPEDSCEWMRHTTPHWLRAEGNYIVSCNPAATRAPKDCFEPCGWCAWDKQVIRDKFLNMLELEPCPD